MRLTCLPERLKAALDVARKPVKANSPFGALAGVCLRAEGDTLALHGTDLRQHALSELSARVDEPGAITLGPKALLDVLAACPDGEALTIATTDAHRATLTCGAATVRLVGGDPEQFPPAPAVTGDSIGLPSALLRDLLETTVFAAARDESRPVLSGVRFELKDGGLCVAAADGHRLAVREVTLPEGGPDLTAILPASSVRDITGALPRTDEPVALTVDGEHARIATAAGTWVLTLIDGQFPDFRRIIPPTATTTVTCGRADLERALSLALAFEEESSDDTKRSYRASIARLEIAAEGLTVRSQSEHGDQEGMLTIPIELEGDGLQLGFNGLYLRDAVRALGSERIALEVNRVDSPAVLHPAGPRNGHVQVCMPMVLRGPT